MAHLLKRPNKLSNWNKASELDKLRNAQRYNDYKLQQLELIENPTEEEKDLKVKIQIQHNIVKKSIVKEKALIKK